MDKRIPTGSIGATEHDGICLTRSCGCFRRLPVDEPPIARAYVKALDRTDLRAIGSSFMQGDIYRPGRGRHETAHTYEFRSFSDKTLRKGFAGRRPAQAISNVYPSKGQVQRNFRAAGEPRGAIVCNRRPNGVRVLVRKSDVSTSNTQLRSTASHTGINGLTRGQTNVTTMPQIVPVCISHKQSYMGIREICR